MRKIFNLFLTMMVCVTLFGVVTNVGTPVILETTVLPTLTYVSTYAGTGTPSTFAEVKRTVDGDTIVVTMDGIPHYIRMVGVDTPETVHPRKPVEAGGKLASDFTKVLTDRTVGFIFDEKAGNKDYFGRYLGYVYINIDGTWYNWNLILVLNGYGIAYTDYPFLYPDLFISAEKFAQEKGLHLWQ